MAEDDGRPGKKKKVSKIILEKLMDDKTISVLDSAVSVHCSLFSFWNDHATLKVYSSNTCQVTLRKMVLD